MRESRPILSDLLAGVAALLALALALHVLPGFDNPVVVSQVHLSGKAAPFTQYANFDKGSAGLLLLAFYCRRAATLSEWRSVLTTTALAAIATGTAVIACALAIGYAAPEAKLPAFALTFLSVNLLFTCVAEEAFFRGLLQERMTRTIAAYPMLRWADRCVGNRVRSRTFCRRAVARSACNDRRHRLLARICRNAPR